MTFQSNIIDLRLRKYIKQMLDTFRSLILVSFFLVAHSMSPSIIPAQVQTNITSSGLGTVATPDGNTVDITGGARPENGGNLFHSFGQFNVGEGDTANFLNDSGLPTENILGRVTAGDPSSIFGNVQTTGFGGANLFLLNPFGFIFGPNSSINIGGTFTASTANSIQLGENGVFFASLGEESVLTVAAPESFGFLGNTAPLIPAQNNGTTVTAAIEIQGLNNSNGTPVTFLGRDAIAGDTIVEGVEIPGTLNNPGGGVNIASIGGAQLPEVKRVSVDIDTLNAQGLNSQGEVVQEPVQMGTIMLSQGSIDTSGAPAGTVLIRGGQLTLDGFSIFADTFGETDGSNNDESWTAVDIETDSLFLRNGAEVFAATFGSSDGGDIKLSVNENLEIRDGSVVETDAFGTSGNAGDVEVHAKNVMISEPGAGLRSVSFATTGNGGNIRLHTNRLKVDAGIIFTDSFGSGNSGDIEVTVQGDELATIPGQGENSSLDLELTGQASILTSSRGSGDAGDIQVTVGKEVDNGGEQIFEGGEASLNTGSIFSQITGNGQGGNIEFKAGNLELAGSRSRIQVENLTSDLIPGNIAVTLTGGLSLKESSTINTEVRNSAPGADLTITAKDITITGGSNVSTTTRGDGRGGNLNISAENLTVADQGMITSQATPVVGAAPPLGEPLPSGDAGNIDIDLSGNLLLTQEGRIAVSTNTAGDGGNINITATAGELSLSDGASITAESTSTGNAGSILLTVNDLAANGGSEITSSSISEAADAGGGGTIEIDAMNSIALAATNVSTSVAGGTKLGGDIRITAGQEMQLTNDTVVSAESSGAGNSGTVTLTATDGNFQSVDSTVSTSAQQAEGGSIDIIAGQNFQLTNESIVSAESSGAGNSGAVTLTATDGNFQSVDSTVSTSSQQAEGGDIDITAGQNVQLVNNTTLSAESFGSGDAGDISVTSGNNIQMVNSLITTQAAQASGGNIKLTAPNTIQLVNSQIISSVLGGSETQGGNINLDPQFIILQNSQILANAFLGNGGNITLTAIQGILISPNSTVNASSTFGTSGTVNLRGAVVAIAETITPLPQNIVKIASLFAERCAAQKGGQFSSFVQGSSDGLPPAPGGFLPSPLMFTNPGALPSSALPSSGQATFASTLPQLRLGLDPVISSPDSGFNSGFRTMNLLPELGCAA